jgi:hypothetical protein
MSIADIIRFPMRCTACIRLMREASGAWLIIALEHGWLHGDRRAAVADARWLACNLGLPVRDDQGRDRSGGRSP